MIVKFFTHGTGGSGGVFNYLLKDKDQPDGKRLGAELLRGDVDNQALLIDSLDFKQKYTSGCLSFAESPGYVTEKQKNDLMDGFEQTIRAGLSVDRVAVSWIEHRDKGRLELNFVFANVDLEHGRAFQPYVHSQDKRRVNAWKDMQNIKYGFTDPNDPLRKRLMSQRNNLPRDVKDARQAITDGLKLLVVEGVITNRDDVIQSLTAAGFEIARETEKAISIKNPNGKRNIRLTGGLYERDFDFSREVQATVEQASTEYRAGSTKRYSESKQLYDSEIERKREYHQARHGKLRYEQRAVAADANKAPSRYKYSSRHVFEQRPSPFVSKFKPALIKRRDDDRELYKSYRDLDRAERGQNSEGHQIRAKNLGNVGWHDIHNNAHTRYDSRSVNSQEVLRADLQQSTAAADQLWAEVKNGQTTARSDTEGTTGAAGYNTPPRADARHKRQRYSGVEGIIAEISRDANAGIAILADEIQEFNGYDEGFSKQYQRAQPKTQRIDVLSKNLNDRLNNAVRHANSASRAYEQLSKYDNTARRIKQQNERIRDEIEGTKDFTEYNQDYAERNKQFAEHNRQDTARIREGVERIREVKQEIIEISSPKATYSSPRL